MPDKGTATRLAKKGAMNERWRFTLLGSLRAEMGGQTLTRFRTQKAAALIACLAHNLKRTHAREELVEQFWPDSDLEAGRSNLRTALASLRRQLEPPGVPAGTVLVTDRLSIHLNPAAVTVDSVEFEAALRAAERAGDPAERIRLLQEAVHLYNGDLLPGFYEDWILTERERLSQAYQSALRQLT